MHETNKTTLNNIKYFSHYYFISLIISLIREKKLISAIIGLSCKCNLKEN